MVNQEFNLREAKSNTNLQLTGDLVLLKTSTYMSIMSFATKVAPKEISTKTATTIEGYGPRTHGVGIGDVVNLNSDYRSAEPFLVRIPGHDRSFGYYAVLFDKLTKVQQEILRGRGAKYLVEQYVVVPFYGITSYFAADSKEAIKMKDLKDVTKYTEKEAKLLFGL